MADHTKGLGEMDVSGPQMGKKMVGPWTDQWESRGLEKDNY
jgi:hypothetical protein